MAAEPAKSKKEVARKEAGGHTENLQEAGEAFLPEACIYENEDGLMVRLDIPGVKKGDVQIEVDETDTLQMRAKCDIKEPEGALFREWENGGYYRSFRLGPAFEKDNISAKLEDGVLELKIPRREETKPRRIAIQA